MEIRKEKITFGWYIKGFLVGLLCLIPFTVFVFIIPVIGWIFIPTLPFFPFIFPFIWRESKYKKQIKEAKKKAELKKLGISL